MIFLEPLQSLAAAVRNGRIKKTVHAEKIGGNALFAYDETKRMLAVCGVEKVCS